MMMMVIMMIMQIRLEKYLKNPEVVAENYVISWIVKRFLAIRLNEILLDYQSRRIVRSIAWTNLSLKFSNLLLLIDDLYVLVYF